MSNLPEEVLKYTAEYEAKKRSFKETRGIDRPEVVFKKGARFYKNETTGKTMFLCRLDVNNEFVGVATDRDRDDYPKEWIEYAKTQKSVKK